MYPKKKPKTDEERFHEIFIKKVGTTPDAKSVHTQRAANSRVPVCPKCGAQMVLRTGQSGARKGQKFWGCSNYPACRYTKNVEPRG